MWGKPGLFMQGHIIRRTIPVPGGKGSLNYGGITRKSRAFSRVITPVNAHITPKNAYFTRELARS